MIQKRSLKIASFLLLLGAVTCAWLATTQPDSGVRIPVHCANNRMGYIDSVGRMVIAPKWNTATPFGPDHHALVSISREPSGKLVSIFNHWVLRRTAVTFARTDYYRIDRSGNLTPAKHPGIQPEEVAAIQSDSIGMRLVQRADFRWLLADGSPAFPGSWQQAMDFKGEDPAAVFENGRWGFINRRGETVIPFRWDKTLGFDGHGRACVAIGWKWGVIDRQGKLVVPLRFKSLAGFGPSGLCATELASGWGFVDSNGKLVIPLRYRKAESFDRFDMAKVQLYNDHGDLRCGWIDRNGKFVVQPIYDIEPPVWSPNFSEHELLPVATSGKAGLIDRRGRTVVVSAQGELEPMEDPMAPRSYWIATLPYRSVHSPDGRTRPPFQPACYDSRGILIWNGSTLTRSFIFAMGAVVCGLISGLLFLIASRLCRPIALP